MAIFTNQATLTYNNTSTNSNVVTGEIVEALAVTKTAITDTYNTNDVITYVVSIINSGDTANTDLTLTDNLGEYTFNNLTLVPLTYVEDSVQYYVNGVLQADPTVTDTNLLTITGISVPANGNVIVIYQARVNEFAPLEEGSEITNTVTTEGCSTSTAQETITVDDEPFLTITKALSPDTVIECSELTYTFTIQNYGNTEAVATDNVTVTDTFDPILRNITVTLNGTVLTPAQYTYDETTGEFSTTPSVITVPAATFEQDPETGRWTTTPGVTTLTVTGTV